MSILNYSKWRGLKIMNKKYIMYAVIFALFFYLCGSFYATSFNISRWSEVSRFMFLLLYIGTLSGIIMTDYIDRGN